MTESAEPWWANDPVLAEIRQRTWEEFEGEVERCEPLAPDLPDPVVADFYSGTCRRELGLARDGLADAHDRYDDAVLNARTAGMSWGEIGAVLGVARQELHRRYRRLDRPKPGATSR
ncbi:MAG: AsnC family protein [Mycobacterium sp.]